jgi:hypothetical protein
MQQFRLIIQGVSLALRPGTPFVFPTLLFAAEFAMVKAKRDCNMKDQINYWQERVE